MENKNWKAEVEKRMELYFPCFDIEHVTREVYDWNREFIAEYYRLNAWTSEDGTMIYARDYIEKKMGFDYSEDNGVRFHNFLYVIRMQNRLYVERQIKAQYAAGRTAGEIAADLGKTEEAINRAIERLCE